MSDVQRFQVPYLVIGTVLTLACSAWFLAAAAPGPALDVTLVLLLGVVGLTVRSASFRLNDLVVVTLDTTVFMASLFILGERGAAVVVLGVTGLHLIGTLVLGRTAGGRARAVLPALFAASATLASLLLASWLVDVEPLVRAIEEVAVAHGVASQGAFGLAEALAWKVGVAVGVFLLVRYALVLPRHRLGGAPTKQLVVRVLLPGLGFELALLPLAYLVIFMYHRALLPSLSGANAGFLLVLVTYGGVVIGIRFLARYGEQVRTRLQEMERINRFHSKISSSLQLNLLAEMVTDTLLDTFLDVDGAAVVLQRENLVRVRGRTDEHRQRVESDTREYLRRHDESQVGSTLFLPLSTETRGGGGVLGFYRGEAGPRRFSKADQRLFRLLVNIVDVAVQNARLYEIATIDGLTGLYVRRYFEQRLAEEFIRSGRYGENFTLMLVDLNYFKQINDVYGHLVGDRILKAVGGVLRDSVRSMDVPARYGGDEFAILLPRASREDAELIRERIDDAIARCFVDVGNEQVGVSASIGMASFVTDRPADPTEMILKADDRLYDAKKNRKKPLSGPKVGEAPSIAGR
jgi:diguanylate cyclase (GGDEF)-like protein